MSWRRRLGFEATRDDVSSLQGWDRLGDTPAAWVSVGRAGAESRGTLLWLLVVVVPTLVGGLVSRWVVYGGLVALAVLCSLRAGRPRHPVTPPFVLIRGHESRYIAVERHVWRTLDSGARLSLRPVRRLGLVLATEVEVTDGVESWVGEMGNSGRTRRRVQRAWGSDDIDVDAESTLTNRHTETAFPHGRA